jgi:hypothetical protein
LTRRTWVCLLPLLIACDRTAHEQPAVDLTPRNAQSSGQVITPRNAPAEVPASVVRRDCITWGRTALHGVVRQEVRFGAPGYGEDTLRDERDTIAVLVLPHTLALCPDSARHAPGDAPVPFDRVTLRYVPRAILSLQGREATVFGRLEEAGFAFEQGPILLRVDSVPELRTLPIVSTS